MYSKSMSTLWIGDANQSIKAYFERAHHFYIHVENLPKHACQSEVKTVFNEFDVPEGGISIYGSDAFVAFANTETALTAFSRAKVLLLGTAMKVSLVKSTKTLKDIIYKKVRRNLNFDRHSCDSKSSYNSDQDNSDESGIVIISDEESSEVAITAYGKKRIRPTSIPRGYKRLPFSCLEFFPEEIVVPKLCCETSIEKSRTMEQIRSRKIRPKPAIREESSQDWEKSPSENPKIKLIKLDETSSDSVKE